MRTLTDFGHQLLQAAHLSLPVHAACQEALTKPGRLFSARPVWARLFLAWADALGGSAQDGLFPAAVACECLATGFDLIDDVYDAAHQPRLAWELGVALPAGVALLGLAQDAMAQLDPTLEHSARAGRMLARASRRVFAAQAEDYALRRRPTAAQGEVLAVLRRRSGTLGAAPCQCAALLAGAPWRLVALAGRIGHDLGCAAQLEDDLTDRADDACGGRKTVPTVLAALYPDAPDVVEATTWVLMQHFLLDAAQAIQCLPTNVRTEPLWTLLPPAAHVA